MKSVTRKSLAIAALVATIATTAAPAEAQRHRRHHRGDNDTALAIGIIGLGIGAAITSSNRDRYYYGGYDPYYYGSYHGPRRGYYAPRYRRHCTTRRVYDPYIGRRVRVRYCR